MQIQLSGILAVLPQVANRDLFIILSMILLCVFAVSRVAFPKLFAESLSPDKLFGFRLKEDLGSSLRPFSTEHIYFTGLYSLALSFVALFLVNQLQREIPVDWLQVRNIPNGLLVWLVLGIALNLVVYLKYLLILLLSSLFNTRGFVSRHFIDFINASLFYYVISAIVIALGVYASFIPGVLFINTLKVSLLIFLFYRCLLLYIRLMQLSNYSKLYIFSYICSTELIPLIIGLKFLST